MAHQFTSGIMMNAEPAWHGLGQVIEGTLPAEEAFRRAGALFPVGKLHTKAGDPDWPLNQWIDTTAQRISIWRPDQRLVLGHASPGYQVIPNTRLLEFASSLREEVDMDTVIVLAKGRRVAFTAKLRGTNTEVVPGDTVFRNICGYLGHDGCTGFGGLFTNTRVVCANTLGFALTDAQRHGRQFTIRHTEGEVCQIDHVLSNIDFARQTFVSLVDNYKAMQSTSMNVEMFRHWLTKVYDIKPVTDADGNTKPATIEQMPRKWAALERAWNYGLGSDIPGVKDTVYAGLNAVTEVETSAISTVSGQSVNPARKLNSTLFGAGASVVRRAETSALELVNA